MDLDVIDPSNPSHIYQFNQALANYQELQLNADETGTERIVGYPKLVLEGTNPSAEIEYASSIPAEKAGEKFEEEIHEVTEKNLEQPNNSIGMHEQTIADSYESHEKRFEDGGNVEIIEESYEKVTTSNIDVVEPSSQFTSEAVPEAPPKEMPEEVRSETKVDAEVHPEELGKPNEAAETAETFEKLNEQKPIEANEHEVNLGESHVPSVPNNEFSEPQNIEESFEKIINEKINTEPVETPEQPANEVSGITEEPLEKVHENVVEEAAVEEEPSEKSNLKTVPSTMEEIIVGTTADNKEIIAGLQEKDSGNTGTEPLFEKHVEQTEASPSAFEQIEGTKEATDTAGPTTDETPNAENDDVEGIIQKVILDNVGVAGLIHDLTLPPTPQEKKEIIAGVTANNQEIIAGMTEEQEKIPLEAAAVPELEETKQLEESAVTSETVKPDTSLAAEVSDEFKDVNQWLVFTRPEPKIPATAVEEPLAEKVEHTELKETSPKDEIKDVKQWLVFTKGENEPETKQQETTATEEEEPTNEEPFKHVKQWLVINHGETSSAVPEGSVQDETKPISQEATDEHLPPTDSQLEIDLSTAELEVLHHQEFEETKQSPTTHKQMFGSSRPEEDRQQEEYTTQESFQAASAFDSEEVLKESAEKPKKQAEKRGGIMDFFKSIPVFSDNKAKSEEQKAPASDEFSDTTDFSHITPHTEFGNDNSLQEIISEVHSTAEPGGVVIEETKEIVKTSDHHGGQEGGATTATTTTTRRTQKKRTSRYSKKDKKGSPEDHSSGFI